ncbi:conjugal transfer protein, partial [Enterococcus faecium]
MESIVRNIEFLFKKEFFLLFILEETMKKIKS